MESSLSLRSLLIMEIISSSTHPLTLGQLVQRSRIPKSSVNRQLQALAEYGFITRLPGQLGYLPGARMLRIGMASLRTPSFISDCRSILKSVVDRTHEACNLTVLSANSVHYLVREESQDPLSLQLHLRSDVQVPLHCTASGKLFLAHLPLIERNAYLQRLQLTPYTSSSIVDLDTLKQELESTRRQGFGVDNEEFVNGMVAIAIPVFDENNQVIAAVACHAVSARADLGKLLSYRSLLTQAAEKVATLFKPTDSAVA